MQYIIEKAEKHAFAVYQTIYSNADTNLNFDWNKRLEDTKWSDDCYWMMKDDQRIGGLLIQEDSFRFPFLITPFCDKWAFWRTVLDYNKKMDLNISKICSILDEDVAILLKFGYKLDKSRRMMCRPTEIYSLQLDERFICIVPDINKNVEEMTSIGVLGYSGGIDYQIEGACSQDEVRQDFIYYLSGYAKTNTLSQSSLICEKNTGKLVALCTSGRHPNITNERFSLVSDICVLPEYRGNGLAGYMLKRALTEAEKTSDILSLCVTVGNNAESLYHKLGFWGGAIFSTMSLR